MDRILITDDHPFVRNGICALLASAFPDCELRQAASLSEAINCLSADGDFDLVTLDLDLPDAKQLEALSCLRARFPSVPIAILSASRDPCLARAAISAGAVGFISKSENPEALISALMSIRDCGTYVGSVLAKPEQDEVDVLRKANTLTPQQRTVFKMIVDGLPNKQIAYKLDIALSTVKLHVSAVLEKLEVASRTQATIVAKKFHIFP